MQHLHHLDFLGLDLPFGKADVIFACLNNHDIPFENGGMLLLHAGHIIFFALKLFSFSLKQAIKVLGVGLLMEYLRLSSLVLLLLVLTIQKSRWKSDDDG